MVLSCPNCNARFNLGNIQVEHVRCPVCYSIWQVSDSKLGQTSKIPLTDNSAPRSSSFTAKKKNGLAIKAFSYVFCLLAIFLTLYASYCIYSHHKHLLYCSNQIKVKELRCNLVEGQLQLRCQIHNVAEKQVIVHKVDFLILEEDKKMITKSILAELILPPYSATHFSATIPSNNNFLTIPNITIKLR